MWLCHVNDGREEGNFGFWILDFEWKRGFGFLNRRERRGPIGGIFKAGYCPAFILSLGRTEEGRAGL
jgi:hypothetical protein